MLFFNSYRPGSLCKKTTQSVITLFILLCLLTVLPLAGCKMNENNYFDDGKLKPGLVGDWKFEYEGGYELYTITANPDVFIYTDTFAGTWGGNIVHVSNFGENAGVLIIEYDIDKKQQWTDWNTMSDITPDGNFYGIYFTELKQNSVRLANTSDSLTNYGPTETETLEEAINKFTSGNKGDLTFPGGAAQIKQ